MRILFIGCVKSSEIFLKALISMNTNIVGVITKEESFYNSDFVNISYLCVKENIAFKYVNNINSKDSIGFIKKVKPDVIFCFGWSQLLKEEILNIPAKGCYGFHPAALPNNKGRHPIIWALALGLNKTASTFFRMDTDADAGDIISQVEVTIEYEDDADMLYMKIMKFAVKQLEEITDRLESDTLVLSKQENIGNVWRKRGKQDGKIDWRMSSRTIYNLVRALTKPYMGAHFEYNSSDYKIWKVEEISDQGYENIEYGKVLKVYSETEFLIRVADGIIHVLECEPVKLQAGTYL